MNPSKTELPLFSSRHQIVKCTVTNINVADKEIVGSYLIKYLGMWLDQHLTFNDHVTNKCKTAMLNVLQVKLIRNYTDQDTCTISMCSLVVFHLEYNSLLTGIMDKAINKMFKMQQPRLFSKIEIW